MTAYLPGDDYGADRTPVTIKPLDDSERCPRCGKYGADGHTLACDYLEGE